LNGPSFANVYCPNDDNDRRVLWDELVQLCSWWGLSRCIGGDFNIIRYLSEISSETRSSPAIFEFTKLIFDQGLMNIPLVGGNCKSPWALLTLKRRLERGGVSMAYKVYKTRIS
jgi:hypothetical protein